jgi:ABC-2 type transport system ATP-binding protein
MNRVFAAAPPPAIEIAGLIKRFPPPPGLPWGSRRPDRQALAGLDLVVPAGQALAILGPNGAGKSTLLRILATLVQPTAGQVRVAGIDVRDDAAVRRQVGWATGDDRAFYWTLSGQANLAFFAALQGLHGPAATARIAAVLEAMGLGGVATQAYRAYSSGMRQRLALARALLHEPAVLLLDEPTRSLDPETAEEIRALLRATTRDGHTLIWVTHNPVEAQTYCDRLVWMRAGQVVADRPAGDPQAARPPWKPGEDPL